MALVEESTRERYFSERVICRQHQILGHLDAPLHQPAMRRNSSAASEGSGKVADGKPALAGNLFQREVSIKIGVDCVSRKPQLPRRQSSAHQGARKMHAAICTCEMYIQRGRDTINKLLIGAGMPFGGQSKAVAEVQNDGIVGGNAGLYAKRPNSIGAVILSELIESGSRNEEIKAVGCSVFGMGRRIKDQVDKANRAMWKGDYLEMFFFRLAGCEDIPLQGQDEPTSGWMVPRTSAKMRFAELRYVELAPLQRPVSSGNRGLQNKEIAIIRSAFQRRFGGNCSRRIFRLRNC